MRIVAPVAAAGAAMPVARERSDGCVMRAWQRRSRTRRAKRARRRVRHRTARARACARAPTPTSRRSRASRARGRAEPLVAAVAQHAHRDAHDAVGDPARAPCTGSRRAAPSAAAATAPRALVDHLPELAAQLVGERRIADEHVRLARHQQASTDRCSTSRRSPSGRRSPRPSRAGTTGGTPGSRCRPTRSCPYSARDA